jgi:hypothetical protein
MVRPVVAFLAAAGLIATGVIHSANAGTLVAPMPTTPLSSLKMIEPVTVAKGKKAKKSQKLTIWRAP